MILLFGNVRGAPIAECRQRLDYGRVTRFPGNRILHYYNICHPVITHFKIRLKI